MVYLLISFRKSTAPQNRQFHVYSYELEYLVDGFAGELTFLRDSRGPSGERDSSFRILHRKSLHTWIIRMILSYAIHEVPLLSHRKFLQSRLVKVNSRANPATYY